ncbi:hypothetical protein [Hymenobacter glacieicola]|uniref:Glycosyltransferase RgtA/B/C/D-like domain-containing protein n=1 Tax=Hymenobacter glacieicola TaxID=1562124 RepID=A0ABQ1WS78_9BACT|nr:hypothetical protein [Hymenobacter glacieicola]GGG43538.1 hypothetical protein GCM10011378_19920 [Hymenobacter glacieicola]
MLAFLRRSFASLPLSLLALFFLALSGSLGLLYSWVSLPDLQAVRQGIYGRNEMSEFVLQATLARLSLLRYGLLAVAVGATATLVYMVRSGRFRSEIEELRQQFREVSRGVVRAVQHTSRTEKLLAILLLLGILGLRLYYFRVYPLSTDEVATYDYFVRGGPVAITSFYPIPNNHMLFSLSCWVVSWFTADDGLVLRLPTLLISLVGTLAAYTALIRVTNFRMATLAVGLFCLSPMSLYYAVAGRGYFLLIVLALGQFFAMLAILHAPRYARLGWGAFIMTGVLGLYTIPTYAYPLVSLGFWMGVVFLRRRNLAGLRRLTAAAVLVAAGALVAYGPVMCVSGLNSVTDNQYIAPQTLREFWQSYGLYLYKPARELFGHEQLSAPGFVVLLAAALLGLPILPHRWRRVALPAVVLVLLPFVFMPIQRVYSPARVLLYGTFFFFLGVAALGEWVLQRLRVSRPLALAGIGALLSLYGIYQAAHFRYSVRGAQTQDQQLRQAYAWLRPRQARRVYFDAPFHKLYFHHYALTTGYPLWLFEATSAQGTRYDYVVLFRGQTTLPAWLTAGYRPVYSDAGATIYQALAPPAAPPAPTPAAAPRAGK